MTSRELTSGFDFWLCGHLSVAYIIWCKISLSSPKLLTFFRNSRWRPPPSWIFSLCEFGHSDVLVVWYLCSVSNLVEISVIVTEIDAHMLQNLHFMTSRVLTSSFDLWSRGHLCMAVMHLSMKFGADIFIQFGVIGIFWKLKMVTAAILELFRWAMRPPMKPHSWRVPPVKILSW